MSFKVYKKDKISLEYAKAVGDESNLEAWAVKSPPQIYFKAQDNRGFTYARLPKKEARNLGKYLLKLTEPVKAKR